MHRTFLRLLVALAILIGSCGVASAGYEPPRTIKANVALHAVYCQFGVCCGQVYLFYRGHYYDRPRGYCRWFRSLRDGEIVTTTLTLGW